jgi:dihydrofolate synthase/folylpolyglutamate synthase
VSIGQQPVEESRFANTLGRTIDAYERAVAEGSDGSRATWFDVLTAAAFVTFAEARLDWVIVEVGLGGRLDSTNVVDGDIAVVTNVELEHTEVLGTTRAEIAGEKIGILKPGATLVTTLSANDLAGQVAQMYADRLKCRVLRAENVSPTTIDEINATLARLVLDELGRRKILAPAYHQYVGGELLDNVTRGAARLPGRMEIVSVNDSGRAAPSLVVLDGAHVPFNIEAVLRDLSQDPRLHGPKVVLVALAADKKASGFMQKLAGDGDSIICTTLPGTVKSHHPAELARSISSSTPSIVENWSEALTCALDRTAATGQWLLVTGSLHLVGQVRRTLLGAAARRI